jgi:hypothetical protein
MLLTCGHCVLLLHSLSLCICACSKTGLQLTCMAVALSRMCLSQYSRRKGILTMTILSTPDIMSATTSRVLIMM